MFAYLKGTVMSVYPGGRLILDVQNVGYEIFTTTTPQAGETLEFWIYTYVREDTFSLYGFLDEKEKEVFVSLIKINGVGPKSALGILSSAPYTKLMEQIESEDIKALCQLPKIGKKTAGQMILSLKGKWPSVKTKKQNPVYQNTKEEITTALLRLGFRSNEVKPLLDKVDVKQGTKEGLRQALSILQNL